MRAITKLFLLTITLLSIQVQANTGNQTNEMNQNLFGEYGIHLFFNEKEFVDDLIIGRDRAGNLHGTMYVPNDFDGDISNIVVTDETIIFDLFVPKNSSRPTDLIFHYEGKFFNKDLKQIVGFVTIKGQSDFVASFIALKRNCILHCRPSIEEQ